MQLASTQKGLCRLHKRNSRRHLFPGASTAGAVVCSSKPKSKDDKKPSVSYGQSWYKDTRSYPKFRTVREELDYRRAANQAANNGRERKDLYTDNWDGAEYKGSGANILTLLAALFVLTPVAGLVFAYFTYGRLWG